MTLSATHGAASTFSGGGDDYHLGDLAWPIALPAGALVLATFLAIEAAPDPFPSPPDSLEWVAFSGGEVTGWTLVDDVDLEYTGLQTVRTNLSVWKATVPVASSGYLTFHYATGTGPGDAGGHLDVVTDDAGDPVVVESATATGSGSAASVPVGTLASQGVFGAFHAAEVASWTPGDGFTALFEVAAGNDDRLSEFKAFADATVDATASGATAWSGIAVSLGSGSVQPPLVEIFTPDFVSLG